MIDILSLIHQAISFGFIQRALLAGSLIALTCAVLGTFLILRRFSLIGDGIAHVCFAAIALALVLHQAPLVFAVPFVVLASLLILELSERSNIYGDTALGIVSSFSVALGVLLASVGHGFNVDLFSFLFGNILSIAKSEVVGALIVCVAVVAAVVVLYHELFSITFDEEYAKASGVPTRLVNRMLIILTAITVVLGVRVVGTMLVSGLIILPAATALQLVRGFKAALITGAVIAVVSVVLGVFGSYILNIPTGSAIIILNTVFFVAALVVARVRG